MALPLPFPKIANRKSPVRPQSAGSERRQGWLQRRGTSSIGQDPFCAISAVMGLVLWMHAYYKYVAEYPMQSHILHSIDSAPPFPALIPIRPHPPVNPRDPKNCWGTSSIGQNPFCQAQPKNNRAKFCLPSPENMTRTSFQHIFVRML